MSASLILYTNTYTSTAVYRIYVIFTCTEQLYIVWMLSSLFLEMATSNASFACSLQATSICFGIVIPSSWLSINCGRPWPAAYISFNQNIHQIQVLTKPLCRAQAIFYSLRNNEWGTKYHGLTYSAKKTVREICRATYSARQTHL